METTTKIVRSFEVISHGVDHAQYFQGSGTSFTSYTDHALGCGNSEREALEDALESLAMSGWQWSDDTCPEPDPADYSDEDEVQACIDENTPSIPEPEYGVTLHAYNGMSIPMLSGATYSEATTFASVYAAKCDKRGQEVSDHAPEQDPSTGEYTLGRYEIQWPGQGVGDDEGMLHVECSNADAIEQAELEAESAGEDCELHYYVTVRVSETPEEA